MFSGNPFVRLRVYFAPQGGTRVEWELTPHLHDPLPYTFKLQTCNSATPGPADWVDVGLPAVNAIFLTDDAVRLFGKTLEVYYRILLTTPSGTYTSMTAGGLSAQDYRDWRIAHKILRQESKRVRYTSIPNGRLVKERRYGPPCTHCNDPLTNQPQQSKCPVCYGVGILGGYFPAVPCSFDLGLDTTFEMQDDTQGTVKEASCQDRFAGQPHLNSRDFVVDMRSGRRWIVEEVQEGAAIRGYVLVEMARLRVLPFTDVIYQVPVV